MSAKQNIDVITDYIQKIDHRYDPMTMSHVVRLLRQYTHDLYDDHIHVLDVIRQIFDISAKCMTIKGVAFPSKYDVTFGPADTAAAIYEESCNQKLKDEMFVNLDRDVVLLEHHIDELLVAYAQRTKSKLCCLLKLRKIAARAYIALETKFLV